MSIIQTRAELITAFATGEEPDGDEYMVLINSLVHTNEDDFRFGLNDYIDGSIGNDHEGFFYPEGRCSVHDDNIYRANKQTIPGPWVSDDWDFIAGVIDATNYIKRIGTTVNTGFTGDTHYESGIALHGLDLDKNIVNTITLNKEITIPAPIRTTYAGFTGLKADELNPNISCYWDTEVGVDPHPESNGNAATGVPTSTMQTEANYSGWDFIDIWSIIEGSDYPKLISNTIPDYAIGWTKISTPQELQDISLAPNDNYIVINDIIMSSFIWSVIPTISGIVDLNGFSIIGLKPITLSGTPNLSAFVESIDGTLRRGKFINTIATSNNIGPYGVNSYISGLAGNVNSGAIVEDIEIINTSFVSFNALWIIGAFRNINSGAIINRIKVDGISVNRLDCALYGFTAINNGTINDCEAIHIGTSLGTINAPIYGFGPEQGTGATTINFLGVCGISSDPLTRGLIATQGGTFTHCYYDNTTSGENDTNGGAIPKSTELLQTQSTYIGFNFSTTWEIEEAVDYAKIKSYTSNFVILEDDEIPITNAVDFDNIRNNLSAKYSIISPIDFSTFGNILIPIKGFKGRLKGNGLTVSGIIIDSTDPSYEGLPYEDKIAIFAYTEPGAELDNIRFTNITIIGKPWADSLDNSVIVAPLIGDAKQTTINKVYCEGTIEFNNKAIVGGCIGQEYGCIIANCGTKVIIQSDTPIHPNTIVGGFFGKQLFYDSYTENISNCYSASEVPQVDLPTEDSILRQLVIESLLGAMAISLGGKFELQCSNLLITGDIFKLQTLLAYTSKRHSEFGPRSIPDCEWVIKKLSDSQANSQFLLTVLNVNEVNLIHNKNKKAIIQCFDENGNRCNAPVKYISNMQENIYFNPLFTGTITAD